MTELEKLKTLVSLATRLYQHTDLKIPPTWFSGNEGDDYDSECYHLGWQNKKWLVEIELSLDKDNKEYSFFVFIYNHEEFSMCNLYKEDTEDEKTYRVSIKELLEYPVKKDSKLQKIVDFINETF